MWFNATVSCRVAWGFSCRHWQLWWERSSLFHQDLYLNWDRLGFSLLRFSYRWLSEDSLVFHREQDLCRTALCSNAWCKFISFKNVIIPLQMCCWCSLMLMQLLTLIDSCLWWRVWSRMNFFRPFFTWCIEKQNNLFFPSIGCHWALKKTFELTSNAVSLLNFYKPN